MPNIDGLFGDLFEDDKRADADLEAGTLDHIQRLEAQNTDGSFDDMIAETRAVYTPFAAAHSTTSGTLAQQKGSTDVVGLAEAKMLTFLREGRSQINVSFKGDSTEAIEARIRFYPRGMDPFNEAERGDWTELLTNYGAAVTANVAALPPAFVAEYTLTSQALLTALGKQGGLKGKVSTGYKTTAGLVKPVTMQLSKNARVLGIRFADEPSKGASFFDKRYFERSRNEPASISPGRQRAVADLTLPADDSALLTLTNAGPEPLLFARAADAKLPLDPALSLKLDAGETRTLLVGSLPGTGPLLVVANPSPREGKFRAELG